MTEGLAKQHLLALATREAASERLLAVVAGMVRSEFGATLRRIGERLKAIHECTPRGL